MIDPSLIPLLVVLLALFAAGVLAALWGWWNDES